MGMGFAPTRLRQVSPLLHKTTLTTENKLNVSPRRWSCSFHRNTCTETARQCLASL